MKKIFSKVGQVFTASVFTEIAAWLLTALVVILVIRFITAII